MLVNNQSRCSNRLFIKSILIVYFIGLSIFVYAEIISKTNARSIAIYCLLFEIYYIII